MARIHQTRKNRTAIRGIVGKGWSAAPVPSTRFKLQSPTSNFRRQYATLGRIRYRFGDHRARPWLRVEVAG